MVGTGNRSYKRSNEAQSKPLDSIERPESSEEGRSGMVIVIGVIALTSMIFGFVLGRLL